MPRRATVVAVKRRPKNGPAMEQTSISFPADLMQAVRRDANKRGVPLIAVLTEIVDGHYNPPREGEMVEQIAAH